MWISIQGFLTGTKPNQGIHDTIVIDFQHMLSHLHLPLPYARTPAGMDE